MNQHIILDYLEELFLPHQCPDYAPALNGLQLENSGKLSCMATAVDASEKSIQAAVEQGADFLLVHHGLFWSGLRPMTGAQYRKFSKAIKGDMAIYSLHLPLDSHPIFGNSMLLGKSLGLTNIEPFAEWKTIHTGIKGGWNRSLTDLVESVKMITGEPVQCVQGGSPYPEEVCIVSGGSGNEVEDLHRQGARTLIVGEGAHWSVPMAEELGMNVLYAGHYATETFGVRALGEHLGKKFNVPVIHLDFPTGR